MRAPATHMPGYCVAELLVGHIGYTMGSRIFISLVLSYFAFASLAVWQRFRLDARFQSKAWVKQRVPNLGHRMTQSYLICQISRALELLTLQAPLAVSTGTVTRPSGTSGAMLKSRAASLGIEVRRLLMGSTPCCSFVWVA